MSNGGKSLRPAFCYWGWRAAGGDPAGVPRLVRAAASRKMLHVFALIRDDIVDRSRLRRGRSTAHRRLSAEHAANGWRGSSLWFDMSAAILLGDLRHSWSYELMTGQYLDLLQASRGSGSVADANMVNRCKTAMFTAKRPLLLGTLLADRDSSLVPDLTHYALAVGEAYQVRGDLLGIFGESAETGKSPIDDVASAKRTVVLEMARERASRPQLAAIDALVGDPALDATGLARFRALLVETGAAAAEPLILDRLRSARHAITAALADDARTGLVSLAETALNRRH